MDGGPWKAARLALVLTHDLPLQAQTCLFRPIRPPPPNAPSHLSAEVMTALICSQTINSRALEEASSQLARAGVLASGPPGRHHHSLACRSVQRGAYLSLCLLADDDCTDSFTPNQVARMHCYLDLVYQGWQPSRKPAPIALTPQVVSHTPDSVMLEWFPPIDGHFFER